MSDNIKKNNGLLMKSLIKQSSLMLENYKSKNTSSNQLLKKPSQDKNPSLYESSMNKNANQINHENQQQEFKRYNSENIPSLRNNQLNMKDSQSNLLSQANIQQSDYNLSIANVKTQESVYYNKTQNHQQISAQQRRVQIKLGQSTQTQFDNTDKKNKISSISNQITSRIIPQKLSEQEKQQKLEAINQAIEEERQKKRLLKIQEEKKVMKVISNKILKKDMEINNQNASNLHQSRQFVRSSSNYQSNGQQNLPINNNSKVNIIQYDKNNSLQNTGVQVNNQIKKNSYNFKTSSKNCLEIMQEAMLKRQQQLENSVPYYADAVKDVNNLLTNDLDVSSFFQQKKLIQKQAMNDSQFQNTFQQQQQLDLSKSSNNYFGNLNIRTQSSDFSSQKLMLLKSISSKSQKQASQQFIQRPQTHHLHRQYSENNKSQHDNNLNSPKQLYTSPSFAGDQRYEIQENNKIDTTFENKTVTESNCIERIKKLHRSVFDNNTNNHIRSFFIQNGNYTQGQSNNSTNLTSIQRTFSNNTIQAKNKSELNQTQNKSNAGEKKKHLDNENYGPWDHQKTDTNINGSFTLFTDRSDKNKQA